MGMSYPFFCYQRRQRWSDRTVEVSIVYVVKKFELTSEWQRAMETIGCDNGREAGGSSKRPEKAEKKKILKQLIINSILNVGRCFGRRFCRKRRFPSNISGRKIFSKTLRFSRENVPCDGRVETSLNNGFGSCRRRRATRAVRFYRR